LKIELSAQRFKGEVLTPVLGGSDVSSRLLGIPMTGNASAQVAAHQFARGTPGYNLPASGGQHESYFAEDRKPLPRIRTAAHTPSDRAAQSAADILSIRTGGKQ
jgi:hypothetical protein